MLTKVKVAKPKISKLLGVTPSKKSVTPSKILKAVGRDAAAHAAKLEREFWYRNARFRALASVLPIEAMWELKPTGYCLTMTCASCQLSKKQERDFLSLSLKKAESILDLIEYKTIERFSRMGCTHLKKLLEEDTEEIKAILDLELLIGS